MEIEDIQMFPKIGRIGEELIENSIIMKKVNCANTASDNGVGVGVGDNNNTGNRLSRWHHHHSSRIIRVSRASGGKDRHSKVWTSKGLRDRRVRLSVSTALQFYDLQDRLGYDQPSKAVEWLIKAAADAIAELPSLNTSNFPGDDEKIDTSLNNNPTQSPNQNPDPTASCSSNSETSKNSGLSLSRLEIRDKARERARERTAKEKEKEKVNDNNHASFTELLTGSGRVDPTRQWMEPTPVHATMEYLSSGLILGSGQLQFPHQTVSTPFNSISDHNQHHHHHQEFSFVPDHLISLGGGGSYSLDFNISSSSSGSAAATAAAAVGVGGFSRGTLQSNSPNHQSFFNNLQRFSSDGTGAPFFIGTLPVENHNHHNHHNHHFQLYYEDGCRNSEQKSKGKS